MVLSMPIELKAASVRNVKNGKLQMFVNIVVIALREVGEWCTENG
jgi:hypothetical protein